MRESIEVSDMEAKNIFKMLLEKTISKELNWTLLNVAYISNYNDRTVYIYKGETSVGIMIIYIGTETFFRVSFEEFADMYKLLAKKNLPTKNKRLGAQ